MHQINYLEDLGVSIQVLNIGKLFHCHLLIFLGSDNKYFLYTVGGKP